MQNQQDQSQDQSKEQLSEGAESTGQASDLAGAICSRYGSSPGVISAEFGSGVADHVHQFSDRLPLLRTLQRRWDMEGFAFPAPTSPLLFRTRASRKSARDAVPAAHISARASVDLPAGAATVESLPSSVIASQE